MTGLPSRSASATATPSSEPPSRTAGTTPTQAESPTQVRTTTEHQTATQTRTEHQTATRTETQTETRTAIRVRTETATSTPTKGATKTQQAPAQSVSPVPAAAQSSDTGSSPPAWLWWLIGILALAAVVGTVVALRRQHRKRAWTEKFTTTTAEVSWFARELVPQLEQAPTAQQMAGGWRVAAGRVVSAEDDLTTLEATAVDERSRDRAGVLRDAVRASRARLASLDTAIDPDAARRLLLAVATQVESALARVGAMRAGAANPATPG